METVKEKLNWACKILNMRTSDFELKKVDLGFYKAFYLNKNKRKTVLTVISISDRKELPSIKIECLK